MADLLMMMMMMMMMMRRRRMMLIMSSLEKSEPTTKRWQSLTQQVIQNIMPENLKVVRVFCLHIQIVEKLHNLHCMYFSASMNMTSIQSCSKMNYFVNILPKRI